MYSVYSGHGNQLLKDSNLFSIEPWWDTFKERRSGLELIFKEATGNNDGLYSCRISNEVDKDSKDFEILPGNQFICHPSSNIKASIITRVQPHLSTAIVLQNKGLF